MVAARKGIGPVAHAEVAREAAIAVPTVFAYLPNREALVKGVIRNEAGIWDLFLNYQEHMIPKFAATIRRGQKDGSIALDISPTDAARLIVASAYTITQLKFMGRSRNAIKHFIEQAVEMALGGRPRL